MNQGIFQSLSLIVQIALLLVVGWYTYETQRLRRQSEAQLKLLRTQARLALAPYPVAWLIQFSPGGQAFQDSPLGVIRARFVCNISNPTDRVAHHIRAAVYDGRGNYYWSDDGIEAMGRREENPMVLGSEALPNQEELTRRVRDQYGKDCQTLLKHLEPIAGVCYLLLFFRDLENRLYAVRREFQFDGPRPSRHALSHLYCATESE